MNRGVGLSATNGYIQTNKFFATAKTNKVVNNKSYESDQGLSRRKANEAMLEHDRKRQIELKLLILEEELSARGYAEAEIAEKIDERRGRVLEAKDSERALV